jgi:hypothetical protein
MNKNYILIETNNNDSTFIKENRYFEIYQLPFNIEEINYNAFFMVEAINQSEAFYKFRIIYPNLLKKTSKSFKDIILNLDVE